MRRERLTVHILAEVRAEIQAEAWERRMTLAAYVRELIDKGRGKRHRPMRKAGHPKRYSDRVVDEPRGPDGK